MKQNEKEKRGMNANQFKLTLILSASLLLGSASFGQAASSQSAQNPGQQPQQTQQKPADSQAAPLTLQGAPPPVSAEEDAAYKAFHDAPNDDPAKKEQLSVDFVQKYPQSRYAAEIYSWQVRYYFSKGQIDKMEVAGDKELQLAPNDAQTLAIMGSALPRALSGSMPEAQKQQRVAKGRQYSQKALDLIPTLTKPDSMTDEQFAKAKNMTSALAYSGLGMSAFRVGKYADAIPHFEKAIQLDPQPDPVNYYVLGICNEKTSHFDDAVTDFTKCSDIPGGIQATCKTQIDEAKKLSTTQLSAPK
jgi:tetratricopeptide (TPR) repeat protein